MTALTEEVIAEVERLRSRITAMLTNFAIFLAAPDIMELPFSERAAKRLEVRDAMATELADLFLAEIRTLREDKAALAAEVERAWRPTHRHIKRGTEYRLIATGRLQTEESCEDMRNVAVYLAHDGRYWVRPVSEFIDGRFETLPVHASGPSSDLEGDA